MVLDFSRNQFSGPLPDSWGQLKNLRVLSVGYNNLEGVLPLWVWNLNQLQILVLSNNQFSGTIPADIHNLEGFKKNESKINSDQTLWSDYVTVDAKGTQLDYRYILDVIISLDLSGNKLSGTIPVEIGSLIGLFSLNLSRNLLTGPIPNSLGNVLTLESLDLSNNQLNGTIPTQLTALTSLTFLNLSNNQLSGLIPTGTFYFYQNSFILQFFSIGLIYCFQLLGG